MSSSWIALGDGWQLYWTDQEPHLNGPTDIVLEVLRELYKSEDVLVTPTGPSLPAETSSREAVAIVVSRLYPEATWDDFPDLTALWDKDIPDDAVF